MVIVSVTSRIKTKEVGNNQRTNEVSKDVRTAQGKHRRTAQHSTEEGYPTTASSGYTDRFTLLATSPQTKCFCII